MEVEDGGSSSTESLAAELADGRAALPTVGLLVLANDMVSEEELRRFLGPAQLGVYATRVPCDVSGTAEALAAMERELEGAAGRLLPSERVDAVIFSCTSGTAVIGSDNVANTIRRSHPNAAVVTPLVAAGEALMSLGARKIAVLTPYRIDIHRRMVRYYRELDLQVTRDATFNCLDEATARRISPAALLTAARHLSSSDFDALFISCTAIECAAALPAIEAEVGRPVVTSNQASAWRVLQVLDRLPGSGIGRLLTNAFPHRATQ
jgi:maleate isomerase